MTDDDIKITFIYYLKALLNACVKSNSTAAACRLKLEIISSCRLSDRAGSKVQPVHPKTFSIKHMNCMTDAILSIFDVHNRMPVILPKDKVEDWLMTEEFEALKGTE